MSGYEQTDNKLLAESEQYIRDNRLIELFEDLATAVAYIRPENLNEFLIERLKLQKEQGLRGGIFTKEEAQNVFKLFDLKAENVISKERCIKAIQTMANSSFQFDAATLNEMGNETDIDKFCEICEKVLGKFATREF
jgi:hypothetical protein